MQLRFIIAFCFVVSLGYSQKHLCQQSKQLLSNNTTSNPSNERSDTVDVLHYHIDLNIIDFTGKIISGFTTITFTPKQNSVNTLSLDLLAFTIDSIVQNGNQLTYNYNDTLLVVQLNNTYQITDTTDVTVYYHGTPQMDPSGWGGFYFQSGYAFNLGVGFESVPHNYGRAWFPCFDNFVERSTYSFNIKTSGGKVAICNGLLTNETVIIGDTIFREWALANEIPTYLACVAVSDYQTVHQTHSGINGNIPIELYARAADTSKVKSSFVNLGNAIDAFENAYGPFRWEKVGYSMVPFAGGAMEHATNIAYPKSSANGNLNDETLYAHELSHHWWGDLATCHQAEEMWINEGMARYSEAVFLEHVYGRDAYEQDINDNHLYVIRHPHHLEESYWALDSIPQRYTYGDHVYLKGADVAHTLRGYLGDSLFFAGLTEFLNQHQFTDVSSVEMMNSLSAITSVDLTGFFEGWVMNPGFPEFETRHFEATPNGANYDVTIGILQKLKGTNTYYHDVPLEITFMDADWNQHTEKVMMSGSYMDFVLTIPINPVYATVDFNNLISDAITDDKLIITAPINKTLKNTLMTLYVENVVDSAFIRIEHMWVAPDPFKSTGMKTQLSTSRYWRVDGIIPAGFDARAQFYYDGKETSGSNGWLDNDLVSVTEDSLHLFYRTTSEDDWKEFPYYQKDVLFNSKDKYGIIKIDSLLKGEYTLGNDKYDALTKVETKPEPNDEIKIYPNPNSGDFTIEFTNVCSTQQLLHIYNIEGQKVNTVTIPANTKSYNINTKLPSGNYVYHVQQHNTIRKGQFVVNQ